MELLICKPKTPKIKPTNKNFIREINDFYADDIIMPKKSISSVLKGLEEMFLLEEVFFPTDIIRLCFPHIDNTPTDLVVKKLLYADNTESYFRYHRLRFVDSREIYIICSKNMDFITSNCELFDLFINVYRGIDKKEAYEMSPEYKGYLNSIYMYNMALDSVDNNESKMSGKTGKLIKLLLLALGVIAVIFTILYICGAV